MMGTLVVKGRPSNNSRTLANVRAKSKFVRPNEKHTGHSVRREKLEAKLIVRSDYAFARP